MIELERNSDLIYVVIYISILINTKKAYVIKKNLTDFREL